jgi:Lon protease-like protein
VFPLGGVLLLPEGRLPLNIFEPRYLAMVEDALGLGRMIGMVQPASPAVEDEEPRLFETGCAGRISNFAETEDGRIMLTLSGVSRFRIASEIDGRRGYRRVVPDWTPFRNDLEETGDISIDRVRLLDALIPYLKLHKAEVNRKTLESVSDRVLVITASMSCPFESREKQALLECPDNVARAQTLITLMEMALAEGRGGVPQMRQ